VHAWQPLLAEPSTLYTPRRRMSPGRRGERVLVAVSSKESTERLPDPPLPESSSVEESPASSTDSNGADSNGVPRWDKSITASMDYDFLWNRNLDCKFGGVAEIMRTNDRGVLTCSPGDTLEAIIPSLTQVTGMPVINDAGRLVGVISRKDIIKQKKAGGSLKSRVSKHMTSPAITVPVTASVQEAADVMLENKIRRLPIVDAEGQPVGIVARSDIFKPLFEDQYEEFMNKELAALQGPYEEEKKKKKKITWNVKYLYDGDCAMCNSLKKVLERQDGGRNRVCFVNIAEDNYNPKRHMGITYDDAMETIHAIRSSGEVLTGTEALKALFNEVGLGWVVKITELPFFAALVDLLYNFLSANRLSLGGVGDAIIAAKRMDMSKAGQETCADMDEECAVEDWI